VRVLHISDLHADDAGNADRSRLVEKMLADAKRIAAESPINLVLFTGDLARRGKAEEYRQAEEILIARLVEELEVPREHIVILPGNHDVNRDEIRRIVESGLHEQLVDRGSVSAFLDSPRDVADAFERLPAWTTFAESADLATLEPVGPTVSTMTLELDSGTLGVVVLNSAWRCAGAADKGSLLVGTRDVEEGLERIDSCQVRVVAMHHPLEWLAPFEADELQSILENHGAILLCGHEHKAKPTATKSPRGSAVYLRAGCLYEHVKFPNAYHLIDIDPAARKLEVRARSWVEERHTFDEAVEVAERGLAKFDLPRAIDTPDPGHPPFSTVMARIAAAAEELRVLPEEFSATASAPTSIEDVLIPPRFLSVPYEDAQAAATVEKGISGHECDAVERLVESDVLLVSGDAQAGVSSALFWLLSQGYHADATKMPAYLRAGDGAFGRAKEKATLSKAAGLFGHRKEESADPDLLLAVDDLDKVSASRRQRLAEFISRETRHRYALGCDSESWVQVGNALEEAGVTYSRVFLSKFGRTQLRMLAETIDRGGQADLERIYKLIRTQNLPETPFNMVALIAVQGAGLSSTDLNESNLLEAYVNLLLGSGELADFENLGMDLRKRIHLLGEVAHAFYALSGHSMPVQEVEKFLIDYFATKGLQLRAGDVLRSLIGRHVLIEHDGHVSFRHPAMLHLFLGQWMLEDPAHKEEMLADPKRNASAVTHAAGLKRNDRDLLRRVGEYVKEIVEEVAELVPRTKVDEILEGYETVDTWHPDRLDEMLAQLPERKSNEELDRELDRLSEALDVKTKPPDSPVAEALTQIHRATVFLSEVLRNSELVDDLALKQELFELAIEGWVLAIGVMMADDVHETSFRETIAEVLGDLPDDETEREIVTHFLLLFCVVVLGASAQHHLGNRQLASSAEAALENPAFFESSTAAQIAVGIEARLESADWPKRLDELFGRLPRGTFLRNATMSMSIATYRTTSNEVLAKAAAPILAEHLAPEQRRERSRAALHNVEVDNIKQRLLLNRRSYQEGIAMPEALPAPGDEEKAA
jgi:predicted MPP superfamily phosphohydrolase